MKSKAKVWILVVTVVMAVGVGIGVWVHYDRVHDQETASLVDHAVSSALAGVTTHPQRPLQNRQPQRRPQPQQLQSPQPLRRKRRNILPRNRK